LFCDIDWFKKVNDSRGHAAGDAALQSVAALLRGALREPDIIARYGGEEFVCLLPNTNAASAALVAERLRTGVAERKHDVGVDTMIDLTISIGCATTSAHAPFSSVKELLAAADRRLYLAKQRGRNRVVAEDAAPEPGAQR
jgi:diguanylate cyclase (GGDEF)-like protein